MCHGIFLSVQPSFHDSRKHVKVLFNHFAFGLILDISVPLNFVSQAYLHNQSLTISDTISILLQKIDTC